ncbi:MAG: ATP-dependent Clp protease ATP-binding subunit [Treponema bryantii]|nr:ATP-dependent Clp protease ATP-binding subunit [Treponema bryantii]
MNSFSPRAKKVIFILAQDEARQLGSRQILPEHVILSILKQPDCLAYSVFKSLGLTPQHYIEQLKNYFEADTSEPTLAQLPKSRRVQRLIDVAYIESGALKNNYVGTEHLLLAAIREEGSKTYHYIRNNNLSIEDVRAAIVDVQVRKQSSAFETKKELIFDSSFEKLFETGIKTELFGVFSEIKSPEEKKPKQNKITFLSEYSRDITKLALEEKTDPVVGRDKEINRIIQILSRRTKNNPVLTGEPGVGKTAIVEGLAQRIAQGNVPVDLIKKRILSLDLAALVAGTKYRGEFEERMKKMMTELAENKDIILFIDELHTIIGAGGPEGTMDASNIMKPALSRGEIQIIGATTTKEYRKHIEKDMAFERRFQVVKVDEPTEEETEQILRGIKNKYEEYHKVKYEDDVIPAIIKLSRRYIPEKVLPDKAIDILDEAGAFKKIQEQEKPSELTLLENQKKQLEEEKNKLVQTQDYENAAVIRDKVIELRKKLTLYSEMWEKTFVVKNRNVSVNDIEKIISNMTGIPLEQMSTSEVSRLLKMEAEMHKTVVGQDDAVKIISGAIRRSKAGISSPKHPLGSFIFLGPTGVGKTQLAKALAKYLFGREDSLIRIDMSDYMEKHNSSRLVGAPPGYVGYEEGGVLTEKVRRNPYSVVLLDEIEKAHPDVFNLLLQLLEEGELCDNLGHTVNFRNTIIIMTSNAGARQITNEGRVGFATKEGVISYEEIKAGAMNELKRLMNPELINRIDDVIVFDALNKEQISKILDIQLNELAERLSEKNLKISIKPKAREYLIQHGYNPAMGARPMKRLLRKEVEDPLSMELLSKMGQNFDTVSIECNGEKLKIKLIKKKENNIQKSPVVVYNYNS